jgi:hypothetical protein
MARQRVAVDSGGARQFDRGNRAGRVGVEIVARQLRLPRRWLGERAGRAAGAADERAR